ncbi:MAG TPA: endolytic transglycosylase MltG [Kofleriaceae bacterium]|nr:endolytic transglycosylase MltG [Kofleriaceae bacterium]
MASRSFRTALIIVLGSLLIVVIVAAWMINRALAYPGAAHAGAGKDVEVEVKSGMSFPTIAAMLSERGLIEKPTWFRLYAMWEGDTTNVKTGKYVIKDNLAPRQILAILVAGVKEVATKVTLPEGKNMLEFFELLETAKVAKAAELEPLARDKDFLGRHGITGDTIEGYLFPDTYEFRVNEKPAVVLQRLITRHQEVWNDLLAKHARDAAKLKDKLGWTDRELLIMASIVEKEAVDPAERPRIAQVFINRLTLPSFTPKRLETDPTIRYGCIVPVQKSTPCQQWDKRDRLHRAQLDDKANPYNTYQHEGLPPGPIANPGKGSIEATLSPDGSEYLYFVARDARNHAFARTFDEHKRNVDKYMK